MKMAAYIEPIKLTQETWHGVPDPRYGGPYDRGSADAWYGRGFEPHYYPSGSSYHGPRVYEDEMTPEQLVEYARGYNEQTGRKDWGEEY